jgi:ABC-2 type transport system ATP-binding protein
MKYLSEVDGIADVEIKKAPIEQVISRLYTEWKA